MKAIRGEWIEIASSMWTGTRRFLETLSVKEKVSWRTTATEWNLLCNIMKVERSICVCRDVCIKAQKKLKRDTQREAEVISGEGRRPQDVGWTIGNISEPTIHSGIIFVIKIHNKSRQSVKLLTSTKWFVNPRQRYIFITDIINLAGPDSRFTV